VRLVAVGEGVRFEVTESEHGPQAFNISRFPSRADDDGEDATDETGAADDGPDAVRHGVIAEFVTEKGLGLITDGALRAVFSLDDVRRGTPRVGAACRFRTSDLEALRGEGVLKASEIEIEPR
jgi:hypothetical protein